MCYGLEFTSLHDFEVRLVLQSVKREIFKAPMAKLAITPGILFSISNFMHSAPVEDMVVWTAILIGFFSFLRKSNLVPKSLGTFDNSKNLSRSNVKRTNNYIIVHY